MPDSYIEPAGQVDQQIKIISVLKYSEKTIPQMIIYRKYWRYREKCFGFFYIGSDRVSGVPKAAKNKQNCTCSKLSITTRLQW